MKELYYRSKILLLFDKMFIETGDAKFKFIACEKEIFDAYLASKSKGVPVAIQDHWEVIWSELNTKKEYIDTNGVLRITSLRNTIRGKWNKTMEKYLLFFLEEFYRVQ